MAEIYTSSTGQEKKEASSTEVIEKVLAGVGEKKRRELLGAYTVWPKSRFVNEQADEETVLVLRSHPITQIKWVMGIIGVWLAAEIFLGLGAVPDKYGLVGRMIVYVVLLGAALEKFLLWFYTVFIITNERMVDVDFVNLLHRQVSYVVLNRVEEPIFTMAGLWRHMWHFGDIKVATAAEASTLEAHGVPYPDRVVKIISELSNV